MECEYCKNNFASASNLKLHQSKAKYCLKIQGKNISGSFSCKLCNKKFSRKHHLIDHIETHNEEETILYIENQTLLKTIRELQSRLLETITLLDTRQDIIQDLKKQVESLQRSLERVASKPNVVTTTTNNTLNICNFQPITQQLITDEAIKLTIEDISDPDGIGYARFVEDICRDKLACTDYARSILKWKNEEDIVNDPKGEKLWKLLCKALCLRNEELFREITNIIQVEEVQDTEEFMTRLVHHADHLSAVQGGKRGESSELQRVVVEHLCRIFKK
jgi:hypothetical protein